MVNKFHMNAITDKANIQQASANTGVKFESAQQIADYNAAQRESKASQKDIKKPKKQKGIAPRKGLPTGYDQ